MFKVKAFCFFHSEILTKRKKKGHDYYENKICGSSATLSLTKTFLHLLLPTLTGMEKSFSLYLRKILT